MNRSIEYDVNDKDVITREQETKDKISIKIRVTCYTESFDTFYCLILKYSPENEDN